MCATLVAVALLAPAQAATPLALHPDNPRYFTFAGKPTVLVTSGEHYGAVLNLDFDFGPYLEELGRRGFNQTRTFSGTYREVPGSFKIEHNTLAPKLGRYQSPWVRMSQPGEPERYDLDRFDPAYFARLKAFVAEAGRRGVVVEYVLFCPFYGEELWKVNPMNAANNVNDVGKCPREEVYTLKHPDLLERQLAFVRRAVAELNGFDNLYYEICNEPYFGGVTLDWQRKVAETIVATERDLPKKHLIAQNIANGSAKVEDPDPNVSIFNFHYASPPVVVAQNAHLDRPIGFDETGFKGTGDAVYRRQAWEFLLAGGAGFSHLDYSYTTDLEDGTAEVRDPTPGGGGPTFRKQLAALKRFVERFDFVRMHPAEEGVVKAEGAGKAKPYALVEPGRQYAVYVAAKGPLKLAIELPEGRYRGRWLDPLTGEPAGEPIRLDHPGGRATLEAPATAEDVALRLGAAGG